MIDWFKEGIKLLVLTIIVIPIFAAYELFGFEFAALFGISLTAYFVAAGDLK